MAIQACAKERVRSAYGPRYRRAAQIRLMDLLEPAYWPAIGRNCEVCKTSFLPLRFKLLTKVI